MADDKITDCAVIIYGLSDPITGHLRYIGKTKLSLRRRLAQHINDVKRGNIYIPRYRWLAELVAWGMKPEIFEVETSSSSEWQDDEQFWIAYFRSIGCDLLNATDGGDGINGHRHSEQTKDKQRIAAIRRYQRLGEREKTGAAVREAFAEPEIRAKLSEARKLVPKSSMQKGIDALVAYAKSDLGRSERSRTLKGRTLTEEWRRKISISRSGHKWDQKRKEAQSARLRGGRHSEETKAKMSASAKRRRKSA
jgi:hypothetical protein